VALASTVQNWVRMQNPRATTVPQASTAKMRDLMTRTIAKIVQRADSLAILALTPRLTELIVALANTAPSAAVLPARSARRASTRLQLVLLRRTPACSVPLGSLTALIRQPQRLVRQIVEAALQASSVKVPALKATTLVVDVMLGSSRLLKRWPVVTTSRTAQLVPLAPRRVLLLTATAQLARQAPPPPLELSRAGHVRRASSLPTTATLHALIAPLTLTKVPPEPQLAKSEPMARLQLQYVIYIYMKRLFSGFNLMR